jgi:uncharacterized protein YndB with AHSA1/START domain
MAKPKITVETTVAATIDKAWKYWTSPEHITKWNFASEDWHCPNAENEVKTGGRFKSTMASKDGKMSFDFEGIYDEVLDKKKIAYSLEDGRQVSVVFLDLNGMTKITETFDAEDVNSVELQKSGWQSILDNFKKHVESGS